LSGTLFLILRLALVLALYAFLAWALYTLWRDLRRHGESAGAVQVPGIELNLKVPDGWVTQRFTVPEILIGRDPACDCQLDDMTVSARHSKLTYHHNQWWVEDVGSTNGTYLNHENVTTATVLATGDDLQIGQVTLKVDLRKENLGE
jgi:pSer/pThr/pTyr-binding forkhead associated (FHA) protein